MKNYILSDGRPMSVPLDKEEEFLKQLEKQGLTATLESDELGKSQGAGQPQINQQEIDTESKLEDGSLESPTIDKGYYAIANKDLSTVTEKSKEEMIALFNDEKFVNQVVKGDINIDIKNDPDLEDFLGGVSGLDEIKKYQEFYDKTHKNKKESRFTEYLIHGKLAKIEVQDLEEFENKFPGAKSLTLDERLKRIQNDKNINEEERALQITNAYATPVQLGEMKDWRERFMHIKNNPELYHDKAGFVEKAASFVPDWIVGWSTQLANRATDLFIEGPIKAAESEKLAKGIQEGKTREEMMASGELTDLRAFDIVQNELNKFARKEYDEEGKELNVIDLIERGEYSKAGGLAGEQAFSNIYSVVLAGANPYAAGVALGTGVYGDEYTRAVTERFDPEELTEEVMNDIRLNSAIKSGGEFVGEVMGGTAIRAASGLRKSGAPVEVVKEFNRGFINRGIRGFVGGFAGEAVAEGVTNNIQQRADAWIYGDEKTSRDYIRGALNDGLIGGLMGGPISGTTRAANKVDREQIQYVLASNKWRSEVSELNQKIEESKRDLENAPDKSKSLIQKRIDILNKKKDAKKRELNSIFKNKTQAELLDYANTLDEINEQTDIAFADNVSDDTKKDARNAIKQLNAKLNQDTDGWIDENFEEYVGNILKGREILDKRGMTWGFGRDSKLKSFETTEKYIEKIKEETGEDATGAEGMFYDGKTKTIYIDKQRAAEVGALNVYAHEILHYVMSRNFKTDNESMKPMVDALKGYLVTSGNEKVIDRIEMRMLLNGDMDINGEFKEGKLEEYFEILSDLMDTRTHGNYVKLDKNKTSSLIKPFQDFLVGLGFKTVNLKDGEAIFDFIKTYNKNINRSGLLGQITKRGITRVKLETGIKGVKKADPKSKAEPITKESKTPLQTINDLVPSDVKTQEDYYKLLDDPKVVNRIFDGRKLAPVIERYIRSKSTSPEIASKNIQVVIDRLVNFNPAAKRKDGSIVGPEGFGEFIFANARFGKLVSAKKLFEEGQIRGKTDRIDQQQEGQRKRDIVEDDLSPEEIMIAKQEAEAAKEKLDEISKETLEDKLGLDEKADKEFEKALVTAFGTKLPEIDSKKLRTELRKIVADKLRLKIQKIFGTEKSYDNFIQNDLPSLLGFIKVDDLVQMEREVGGKRFPNGRKVLAIRKRITSVIEVRKLQRQGLIDKRIKPESGPSLKRRLNPTPKELLAFFRGTEAEKTLGYKPPGSTETGMLGTRKDRLAELLTGEIAFNKAIQVAQQQIEKIQFIQEQQNRNIKENIIAELGVTIGRDPSTTIKFSKSEILEQTDLLDNLISDIGFENVIKDGKLVDGFPEMSNLAIQTIGRLYDKNVTLDEEAKAFKQRIFKSIILPKLLIEQYKNVGNLKFNTDMLDLLHEDATTIALELGPEIMNSIGYEIIGYKNRIMDPAKEKQDGSKGEFYDRLINLKEKVNNKLVELPSGLNLKDVRVMNISVSSGLFSKINKILALKSKKEKLKRLKQLQPEIDKANIANIKLAKHIAKTIITLARSGKISSVSALNMLQSQTGIVKGFRGLTRLDLIDVREGSQTASKSHPQYKKALKYYKDSRYDVLERLGFKGEHLKPNSNTMGDIAELIFKEDADVDFELDLILAKHSQLLTSKFTADNIDDGPGGRTSTADFNRIKFLKQPDINSMVSANGRSYQDVLGDVEIRLMELKFVNEIKQKFKNPIILRKAHNNRIKYSKSGESKGMSTFDFDDTLARTKSGVRYTQPNPEGNPAPQRKVIFLAGGAGSGKSNVVKQLGLEKQGFKIVNQDISLEWLTKNSGLPTNMRDFTPEQASKWGDLQWEARDIAQKKQMKFKGRGDGIIVDGTGSNEISMSTQVMKFRNAGYDVQMIFVESSLDVALARNKARKERSLKDFIVERDWKSVQQNKKAFKENFGDNFAEVNTNELKQGDAMPAGLVNKINNFVSGYIKGRLTAEEFASRGNELLQQGAEFDFSEFNKVVDGTPGPLLEKARNRAEKYGTKDMFVLTARPQQSAFAIQQFLKGQGLNIPIGNITGLANSTGQAKADWMLEKFAEGYNDMYFVDDALQNVKAVKNVLEQLDIKSEVVQAKIKFSKSAPLEFNKILEQTKKVAAGKVFSTAEARKIGIGKGKNIFKNFFVPPSAEDFKGLLYAFIGKGEQGNAHALFFKENLLDPFARANRDWNTYKQAMSNDYKALKKQFKGVGKKLNKKVKGTPFTSDNAIRVYLWNKAGFEIPGLSDAQIEKLVEHVENNPELKQFAEGLGVISRTTEGYIEPNEFWSVESIASDLTNIVSKVGRKEFFAEWINNKNIIFSPENLNKIEAIYGTSFRNELEKMLYRMETGRNRLTGKDAQVNWMLDWINGSVGAVMFFNMRSASLQTISMANFINMSDNNPVAAAAALANAPQFIKDFAYIFNSDMLKQRRAGLQIDVSASELTRAFVDGKSKPQAIIHWLLEKGFTPTQIADSFAIAAGGAPFYRNRLKSYLKQGMSEAKAKEQAWLDFQEVAEETQQSSRPDLISNQQAGPLGRLILAWQNTPMQMTRLMKKKMSDFANRRRIPGYGQFQSDMANISGIAYYGLIQNIYFGALQTGLMFMLFGWDDDEEKKSKLEQRVANGALDSILRGTGIYGAGVSTLKNVLLKWKEEADKPGWKRENMNIAQEAVNLSPPMGTKMRKIMQAVRTEEWNKGVSKEIGLRIENPNLSIAANWTEALTNIPVARILTKANNIEEALTGNHDTWQRVALLAGWSKWSLGVEDEELEKAKIKAKETRAQEKKKTKKDEEKKKGLKTVRCSGKNSSGKRCSLTTQTKAKTWKCMHHMAFKDGMDRDKDGIKEYRCKATKSSGGRCNNKTENKNKKCYAHQ